MRFVTGLVGLAVSIPPLIFFWIGTKTFIRPWEKALAFVVTAETGALLLVSIALLFTPTLQRLQGTLLIASVLTVAAIVMAYRLIK